MTHETQHNGKANLRKTYLQKRKALTDEKFQDKNDCILNLIKKEIDISKAQLIHIFLPIKKFNEIDTWAIIDYLTSHGKQIVVSKSSLSSNNMQHFLLEEHTKLIENNWGILEPTDAEEVSEDKLDIVFVPLLVFDKKGNRIGYGKGYYDKFLSKCRKDCTKIGLSLFPPIDFISEMEPMDVPLDYGISAEKVFRF